MKMSVKSTLIAIAFSVSAGNAQVLNEDYKLIASDGAAEDSFGFSVAIEDNIVTVGAFRDDDDNGFNAGSAYLLDTTSTPCSPDLTGEGILAFFDISAFLDALTNLNPIADFNSNGRFNFFDVSAF